MKKILFYIALLFVVVGCEKSSYVAKFDKLPQERVAEQISMVSTELAAAPNGWVATLPTQAGGGYGFYMAFDNEQGVTMYGDVTAISAQNSAKSYYRVKQDMGTELVFDTYNYISLLNDPNGTLGGANKIGYSSDVEFTFDKIAGDTMIFIGKKYRQPFKLTKATAAQKAAYLAGGLKASMDKLTAFFTANKFPYINVVVGGKTIKANVLPNLSNSLTSGKRIELTAVLADGVSISSVGNKFAFSTEGLTVLNGGITFQGITFLRMAWKDATTLAFYDSTGKEYIVNDNGTPLININLLWGKKYSSLLSPFKTIYPGTTAKGAEILNFFHLNLENGYSGYVFNSGRINLIWEVVNSRMRVEGFSSQNGGSAGWITTSTYTYTVDANGNYKFTRSSAPSGGYVSPNMASMYNFFANNTIAFDYHQDGGTTYGKMSSVNDPTIAMTFALQ